MGLPSAPARGPFYHILLSFYHFYKELRMRVVDLVQQLVPIAQQEPHLQVFVQGEDERGNAVNVKLTGIVRMQQDQWGNYILLK
jgi:hypothetical protein